MFPATVSTNALYCNFSATRKTAIRNRLSLQELEDEVRLVLARDMRVIELVYATVPEFTTDLLVHYVRKVAEMLDSHPGSGVLLCTEYLTSEAYAALRDAGLWGIVQWDETLRWRRLSQMACAQSAQA